MTVKKHLNCSSNIKYTVMEKKVKHDSNILTANAYLLMFSCNGVYPMAFEISMLAPNSSSALAISSLSLEAVICNADP